MMHSVHHIYGASERRLDEFTHRIHFAFAKRIFAAGEISRNGAYYTYFIFSNSVHHIYEALKMYLDEFTHQIRALRDAYYSHIYDDFSKSHPLFYHKPCLLSIVLFKKLIFLFKRYKFYDIIHYKLIYFPQRRILWQISPKKNFTKY